LGSVAPIKSRFFEYLDHHRARRHEIDEVFEERTLPVDRIEAFGIGAGHPHHPGGGNPQAGLLEPGIDLPDHVVGHGVRFDDGKRAFNGHCQAPTR
jgi:hypothetical protein